LQSTFESKAAALGLDDIVTFVGGVPAGQSVRDELDRAAIFVLPSLVEGLPRALVEAMARGLPAIGSKIGGIPELLPAECLVEPGDADGLADAIRRLLEDPERAARYSRENLERARQFGEATLQHVRRAFWEYLSTTAEATVGRGG
jgi:glycosyltransferase involved in cell wall biosynthesis